MSAQIPSQFEQKNPDGRLAADSTADVSAATGRPAVETGGAGYGSYGYGYGSTVAGDSELSLVHYLQIIYRRRYIALTVFLVVVLGGALSTFTATRMYEASARILIERENPNVVSFTEVLQQSTEGDDYYETQYEILRGRGLARRTIEALDIWSHPAFNAPPSFSLSGFLMTPVYIVVRWLEPPGRVEAPTPEADETNAQTGVIDEFLGGLGVEPIRFSRLVDLRFTSSDPVLAASAANALAEQYIRQNIEFRSSTTKEASEFLADQLVEQRSKLEASERALQEYRERTDSVSLEARQSIVVQKLQQLNAAVTRADTVRIQKESAYNQVKDVLDNPAAIDSLPSLLSNAFVQQQKTELAQLQRQRAQLSEKLGPKRL